MFSRLRHTYIMVCRLCCVRLLFVKFGLAGIKFNLANTKSHLVNAKFDLAGVKFNLALSLQPGDIPMLNAVSETFTNCSIFPKMIFCVFDCSVFR